MAIIPNIFKLEGRYVLAHCYQRIFCSPKQIRYGGQLHCTVCMVTDSIVAVGQRAKSESQPSIAQLSDLILPVLPICKSPKPPQIDCYQLEAFIGSMRGVILDSNHYNGQVEERNRCSPLTNEGRIIH